MKILDYLIVVIIALLALNMASLFYNIFLYNHRIYKLNKYVKYFNRSLYYKFFHNKNLKSEFSVFRNLSEIISEDNRANKHIYKLNSSKKRILFHFIIFASAFYIVFLAMLIFSLTKELVS